MNAPDIIRRETSQPAGGRTNGNHIPPGDDLEIFRAARTDSCILLTGPAHVLSLARHIHGLSGWRWGQFLTVDCGAPDRVLEQQLFDVLREDSPWPGDSEPRPRLRQAGTLFLQDVERLSPALQTRLADALTRGSARRGASRWRVMASTSEALLPRVIEGTFDDRLFYRLNVLHFVLPPEWHDGPPA